MNLHIYYFISCLLATYLFIEIIKFGLTRLKWTAYKISATKLETSGPAQLQVVFYFLTWKCEQRCLVSQRCRYGCRSLPLYNDSSIQLRMSETLRLPPSVTKRCFSFSVSGHLLFSCGGVCFPRSSDLWAFKAA